MHFRSHGKHILIHLLLITKAQYCSVYKLLPQFDALYSKQALLDPVISHSYIKHRCISPLIKEYYNGWL